MKPPVASESRAASLLCREGAPEFWPQLLPGTSHGSWRTPPQRAALHRASAAQCRPATARAETGKWTQLPNGRVPDTPPGFPHIGRRQTDPVANPGCRSSRTRGKSHRPSRLREAGSSSPRGTRKPAAWSSRESGASRGPGCAGKRCPTYGTLSSIRPS